MTKNSNWVTIFISGKDDFRTEVRSKLDHSKLTLMPGFIEETSHDRTHDLYWVAEGTPLRTFKEAVGGKLIWKYRLQFFTSQEEFLAAESARQPGFSEREREMIAEMRKAS